jgi:hypothetical protein
VLGKVVIKGPQIAHVGIGEPISLGDRLANYQADKRGTVGEITKQAEAAVQTLLTQLRS